MILKNLASWINSSCYFMLSLWTIYFQILWLSPIQWQVLWVLFVLVHPLVPSMFRMLVLLVSNGKSIQVDWKEKEKKEEEKKSSLVYSWHAGEWWTNMASSYSLCLFFNKLAILLTKAEVWISLSWGPFLQCSFKYLYTSLFAFLSTFDLLVLCFPVCHYPSCS